MLAAIHGLGQVYSLRNPLSSGARASLTPPQIHAVIAVGARGALSMGDLRRWLGATGPTVTGIVDRLERLGLVERARDDGDRRVVRLALTRKGRAARDQLHRAMTAKVESMLGLLDEPDRKHLVVLLEKLAIRAGEPRTGPAAGGAAGRKARP